MSCGEPISDAMHPDSPEAPLAKRRFPVISFLIALFAPAAAAVLVKLFYDSATGYMPWLKSYGVPQLLGFVVMSIFCATYAAYLLGRRRSEWIRILCFTLACVLIFINFICVAYAGCTTILK